MPPKNKDNKALNTRSRSASRNRGRDSQPADPDGANAPTKGHKNLSPPLTDQVPVNNNNTHGELFDNSIPVISTPDEQLINPKSKKQNSPQDSDIPSGKNQVISTELGNFDRGGAASTSEVSDNREIAIQTDPMEKQPPPSLPVGTILQMAAELKAIRSRVDKLDKIESSISTLTTEIGGLVKRTAKLEQSVGANTPKLNKVTDEVSSLQESVSLQGEAMAKLTTIKTDVIKHNKATLGEMNALIDAQKEQIESQNRQIEAFQEEAQHLEDKILNKMDEKLKERS